MAWLVDFVKEKEGFREKAYLDSAGVATVGYGSTRIYGKKVNLEDTLSKSEAEEILKEDLQSFLDYVLASQTGWGYSWNNNQVAALTSFVYNLGEGALKQVTQNGTRSNEVIAEKMKLYYNAGGVKLKGLEIRRNEESAHFLGE